MTALGIPGAVRRKPLQVGKLVGVLLVLVAGGAGFLQLVDASAVVGDPRLADGQLLALVFVPLVSLGLVVLVFAEAVVSGYRSLRSATPVTEQVSGRAGYVLLRGVEAAVAVVAVALMAAALPVLFAESTPAPAGVGIMLLLLVAGVAVLLASLVRSLAELLVYDGRDPESPE
ncbi:MAG: hypothetical protein ABEH77_10880 [Halobacteriaceae archaeon]